ncbi:MAG: PIN domain-containing protein [Deltaproteobacteria bacterium]|nr:MAG: PIN domain-containing protein [Deltaproteobacteria bacterium]
MNSRNSGPRSIDHPVDRAEGTSSIANSSTKNGSVDTRASVAERVFVDTNVVIYACDRGAGDRRVRAREVLAPLLRERRAVISTQVLQEFFAAITRKLHVPAEQARRYVEKWRRIDVVVVRPEIVLGAIDLHRLHTVSFWDALVIKSAAVAGCGRVLSEDLNHRQVIDGVTIENPFR